MLQLAPETEQLARQLAARIGLAPDEFIRSTLQREAAALGIIPAPRKRQRMTAADIMAFGKRASCRPVLDPRSPQEIADDLNEL